MKIIRAIIKVFLFAAVVLLMGQISIGQTTIGRWFSDRVRTGWKAGDEAVRSSAWFASLSELPVLSSWLKVQTPKAEDKEKMHLHRRQGKTDVTDEGEKITSADRESLMKLLE